MRITISKRETFDHCPDGQDGGEPLVFQLAPLSLAEEEKIISDIQEQQARAVGQGSTRVKEINGLVRKHVVGWQGKPGEVLAWNTEWSGKLPDDVLASIPYSVRLGIFAALLEQSGMKGEQKVGESE